jgi:hypothetical protein
MVFLVPSPFKAEQQQQQQNGQHSSNSSYGSGSSSGTLDLGRTAAAAAAAAAAEGSAPRVQPPHLSLLVLFQAERLSYAACRLLTSSSNKKKVTAALEACTAGSAPVLLYLDPHQAEPAEHCLDCCTSWQQQHCQAEFQGG